MDILIALLAPLGTLAAITLVTLIGTRNRSLPKPEELRSWVKLIVFILLIGTGGFLAVILLIGGVAVAKFLNG